MSAQLDLFAAPPPPAAVVARATVAAAAVEEKRPNGGFTVTPADADDDDDQAAIARERSRLFELCTRGRETVAVDPKRLDKGGDVDKSYCADTLCYDGKLRSTFRMNGADWVNTGGMWWRGDRYCHCYRVVPIEQFDGPSAPYSQWDWDAMRGSAMGGYHGMSAKLGSREVVLVGPEIVVTAGQPEQSALL